MGCPQPRQLARRRAFKMPHCEQVLYIVLANHCVTTAPATKMEIASTPPRIVSPMFRYGWPTESPD